MPTLNASPAALLLVPVVGLLGCDVPDTSIQFLGVVEGAPAGEGGGRCTYTGTGPYRDRTIKQFPLPPPLPSPPPSPPPIRIVAGQFANLALAFQNGLDGAEREGPANTTGFQSTNGIVPLRFSYRWECDANGFTNGLDTFFMPNFRPTDPFCVNERNEDQAAVGFDVISASGPLVPPNEIGYALAQVIPTQLAEGFSLAYLAGNLADACCDSDNQGCVGAAANPSDDACTTLQGLFNSIGGNYSVNQAADLIRWQPYAVFYQTPDLPPSAFPMRIRGQVEFSTAAGDIVRSNDVLHELATCVGECGEPQDSCVSLP